MRKAEAELHAEEEASTRNQVSSSDPLSGALDLGLLVRWLFLSIGLQCEMSLITGVIMRFNVDSAPVQFIAAMMTVLSVLLGVLLLVAMSITMLTVLRERALGRSRIEDWPGFDVMDWVFDSFYLVFPAFLALLVGLAAGQVFRVAGDTGYAFGLVLTCLTSFVVLYPLMQLGALDNGSPIQIISPTIIRAIFSAFSDWLTFAFASVALSLVAVAVWQLRRFESAIGNFVAALAAVGAVILFFRLMGRVTTRAREALDRIEEQQEEGDAD